MRALGLFLALTGSAIAQPTDPSVAPLVAKIQKFYDSTRDFYARFDQALDTGTGARKKASGEIWLKKPGKMKWSYDKPEPKLMVSDGRTLWIYEPDDQQAFESDLRSSTLPLSVSFLFGQGKLSDEFSISVAHPEGVGRGDDIVLELKPKSSSNIDRLYFAVDPKTGMVRETVVREKQGNVNHLTFSDFKANSGVSDRMFKFSPPRGTKILNGTGKPTP